MQMIIFNHKRQNSTVLNAFVEQILENGVNPVLVVSPWLARDNQLSKFNNIRIMQWSIFGLVTGFVHAIVFILNSGYAKRDFDRARIRGVYGFKFLKLYFGLLVGSYALKGVAESVLQRTRDDCIMFSTWYDMNALAIAHLKSKYPDTYAASYVHSYEADQEKNKYAGLLLDEYKEKHINTIYYISSNVMLQYMSRCYTPKYPEKYKVKHFGSLKVSTEMSRQTKKDSFTMVSCSGISDVKRICLIVESLKLYKGPSIRWTHIGDGSLRPHIEKLAKQITSPNVEIQFLGHMPIIDVHHYYAANAVDLFINVSSSEGVPVSIMEAMSYGIPVLATDVGGNSEIVTSGDTGWLVNRDISASELSTVLSQIVETRGTGMLRDNAYTMWQREYDIQSNVKSLLLDMTKESQL